MLTLPFTVKQSLSIHQRHDYLESATANLQDFPFAITTVKRMKAVTRPLHRKDIKGVKRSNTKFIKIFPPYQFGTVF